MGGGEGGILELLRTVPPGAAESQDRFRVLIGPSICHDTTRSSDGYPYIDNVGSIIIIICEQGIS